MKNVLAVSIALVTMPVLVQAADITEARKHGSTSTANAGYVEPSARITIKPGIKINPFSMLII